MSDQLTVSVRGDGPDAVLQRAVLATVPNDFRVVDGAGDVLLVSGRDGNAAQVLATAGTTTRAIMVASPALLDADSRGQLAQIEAAGTPVMLGFAYVPWFLAEGLPLDAAREEEVAILELSGDVADLVAAPDMLLEQLHIGRIMIGDVQSARTLMNGPSVIVVEAEGGEPQLKWRMTASKGLADRLSVERIARLRRTKVEIVRDAHARPAQVTHHDALGSHTDGPLYQSGYRVCWKALHAALHGGHVPSGTITRLESDLAMLPG
ncbi:hypothetical protein [Novosphingobium sp. BL-52-GroH]|uniref:hypothetical protein n=1 Tax=Novosphingobium sp. BL-52-GroH TaxID=3349877 RepID=UPI00384C5B57